MEINISLDGNGRIRCDTLEKGGAIDFDTKAVMTNLDNMDSDRMDSLLYDCEIADCALMPQTFWMPMNHVDKPRCMLEQLASDIFYHHVTDSNQVLVENMSGAEWWVQIRPQNDAAPLDDGDTTNGDDMSRTGIPFHWDKDENLRQLSGGKLHLHPHISTVTYFTSLGAPTLVCNHRVDPTTGEDERRQQDDPTVGYLSWPKRGKHFSFDGGLLHAAPSDLMPHGYFQDQCQLPNESKIPHTTLVRRHHRVTFLVNIWLNHKPLQVDRFPDTMLGKLSLAPENWTLFKSKSDPLPITVIEVDQSSNLVPYVWPMGNDSNRKSISIPMPIDQLCQNAHEGFTMKILWSIKSDVVVVSNEVKAEEKSINNKRRKLSSTP